MLLFSHLTEVREFYSAAGAVWGPRLPWGVGQRGYSLLEENTPFDACSAVALPFMHVPYRENP